MKKILLSSVLGLSFAISGAAQAQSSDNRVFAGPYVGAYGGYGWTEADTNVGVDIEPDGADYGLYAGFKADSLLDSTINRAGTSLTGALEIHYGWSGADDNVNGVSFEKENEFGVSFRPGLGFFNNDVVDFNPYAIIGYRRTEYEGSFAGTTLDEDFDGFELGVGTELISHNNIGVRADYTHVWYGEENGFDPDEDNIRLGVGYHF